MFFTQICLKRHIYMLYKNNTAHNFIFIFVFTFVLLSYDNYILLFIYIIVKRQCFLTSFLLSLMSTLLQYVFIINDTSKLYHLVNLQLYPFLSPEISPIFKFFTSLIIPFAVSGCCSAKNQLLQHSLHSDKTGT